jgi:DNA-binding transcriptional ArsR family regulator
MRHLDKRRPAPLTFFHAFANYSSVQDTSQASVFEVLADPTRRHVIETLAAGPRRAGELAAEAATSPQVMSRHLRVLLHAGIVADERVPDDARIRVFRLQPQSLAGAQAWLDQLQREWSTQLASFKRHVEEMTG